MESLYKILEIQTFTNTKNQPFENAVLIFQDVNHAINIKTVTVKKSWCYIPENNKLVHMILTSEEIDRIAANQKQTNG